MSLGSATKRLDEIERQFEALNVQMNDPEFCSDHTRYMNAAKAHSELRPVAESYIAYKRALADVADASEFLNAADPSERDFYHEELEAARKRRDDLTEHVRILLLPKDTNDDRNVFVEVRAAAGGEEANLFASEVFRMYTRYAERVGWKTEVQEFHETGIGGVQDVTFKIEGRGAYSRLKYEGGVHRVQRVPATETKGRIHTSTVTVAVMPEAEEVDVTLDEREIKEEVYHSSSAGGQNVQKVATAIRLTHMPTGLVVTCQDERSQLQNKIKARSVLRARLYEMERLKAEESAAGARRSQVGSGERSEKIRTYNFPDSRVTDHRINFTAHSVAAVLDGDIDEFITRLIIKAQTEMLGEAEGG